MGHATSKDQRGWTSHKNNLILCANKRSNNAALEGFNAQFASDVKVFCNRDKWVIFYFRFGKTKALNHWGFALRPLWLYECKASTKKYGQNGYMNRTVFVAQTLTAERRQKCTHRAFGNQSPNQDRNISRGHKKPRDAQFTMKKRRRKSKSRRDHSIVRSGVIGSVKEQQ